MEKVKLGEVLIYEQPTRYIVESDRYDDTFKTPVLTAGKSFLLGYTNETQGIFNELPVIIFDDFTTAIKFVDFPFKVKSSAMKILKPNKEKADIRYLYYKMLTIKTDSEQHKRYWISKYSQIEIPLPPLHIQKAIAAKLDKAQEIISYNQQLLEKYDQLTQSLFIDMFGDPIDNQKGWILEKLKKGIKNLQSGLSLSGEERLLQNDEIAVLKISAVTSGTFKSTEHKVVNASEIKKSIIFPKKGDLLFSRANTREKVGAVAIVDKDYHNLFLPDKLWRIDTNNLLNNIFLKYILSHKGFRHKIERVSTGTSGSMLNISMEKFLNIESPFPPIHLQNQFAERVAQIEIQKTMAQESLAKSQQLFQSLLKESFK